MALSYPTEEQSSWQSLPDLELYMDQVLTLLARELESFSAEDDKSLTSNMINNYVKDGVLPRPEKKKYNREHFSRLIMLCQLKNVLTIPEVDTLLQSLQADGSARECFDRFMELRASAFASLQEELSLPEDADSHTQMDIALQLAIKANLYRWAAANLIAEEAKRQKALQLDAEKQSALEKEQAKLEKKEKKEKEKKGKTSKKNSSSQGEEE